MRKVTFALAWLSVGVALVACGGSDENQTPKTPATPVATAATPAPTTPATAEAPKEEPKPKESLADLQQKTMKAYTAAMNAHDAKALAALYADSGVVKMGGAPDLTGRDAIATSYGKLFEAFKDYTTAPTRVVVKNDVVVVEWTFNGTHTGDLWGVKASEKKVGLQGVDVFWFSPEGQIKEQHVYYDGATIFSQIGMSKQKARSIPAMPTGAPQVLKSTDSPDEAKNTDVMKTMSTAMDAKKEADFVGTMADTVEWDDMTQPVTSKGKNDAKKFLKEFSTGFSDAKTTTTNSWAAGDVVVTENTWTGTHKGSFFGMPATKKSVTVKNIDIGQFKDGKLVKGWGYSNGADFAMQLGLIPKPGDAKGAPPAGDKKPAAGDKKPADPKTGAGAKK